VPAAVRPVPRVLAEQRHGLAPRIAALERRIIARHNSNPDSLATQPRFGPIVASAPDCRKRRGSHRRRRQALQKRAAILRLASRQSRTRPAARSAAAGSPNPATAICASSWWSPPPASFTGHAPSPRPHPGSPACSPECRQRRPPPAFAGAGYALANKMARIAWAMLVKQTAYRAPAPKPAAQAAL
jgi:hypothetical protein